MSVVAWIPFRTQFKRNNFYISYLGPDRNLIKRLHSELSDWNFH